MHHISELPRAQNISEIYRVYLGVYVWCISMKLLKRKTTLGMLELPFCWRSLVSLWWAKVLLAR